MNKFLKRLNRRKGFTLVECIVAIAVFAALIMVVFMILANAKTQAEIANKTEEDLNHLINNVVSDETYRKYREETDAAGNRLNILKLNVEGQAQTFDISYNKVDGYKNFVICPVCEHFANNSDFMGTTKPEDFVQSSAYICPANSSHTFYQTLVCEDCGETGTHDNTSKFTYDPISGGYACNACGGFSVKGNNIDEAVVADAKISVSGLYPNAILYGDVVPITTLAKYSDPANPSFDNGNGSVLLNLQYTASSNQSIPGTYTLTIQPNPAPTGIDTSNFSLDLRLPPHYVVKNYKEITSSGTSTYKSGDESDNSGYIKYNFSASGQFKVQFQLVNYKSGFSFEYDYNNSVADDQGLAGYWFGLNVSTPSRDAAGYVTQLNASGNIDNSNS